MKKLYLLTISLFVFTFSSIVFAREAKLVRYPSYSNGRVAFTYLADIWVADENGGNVQRLTVNRARDAYPKFSPDGKWIAFSSDRNGNLDVYIIPSTGGTAKQLTHHSADDTVLGWTPDGRGILFSSQRGEDFMAQLYVVSVDGGMPSHAGPDMGNAASFSPDGKRIAYNPKGQVYWRKYYRGAYATDVWIEDVSAKKFTQLTDFDGLDSWPMWSRDGDIYFVSDRDGNGLTNIWRTAEAGGKAEKVTSFRSGDVRFPSISADGRTIVFEHDFGIWKLDTASKKVTPIKLDIDAETAENDTEMRAFSSESDDYDLAPSARRLVVSVHGEIFSVPVEEGDIRQITDSSARDRGVAYSPDGKWLSFISDSSGREELYVVAVDGSGEAQKLSDIDTLKLGYNWSPDSKEIAFTTSDSKLRKVNVGTKQTVEIDSSRYGNISTPEWSPDGKWLAYSKADASRTTDVYVIASSGQEKEAHKVTFDSYDDRSPRFAPDGRKLFFIRSESAGGGGFANASVQIYSLGLEKLDRDPDDPEERPDAEAAPSGAGEGGEGASPQRRPPMNRPPHETKMDWTGMKRRTRQVTRMPFPISTFTVAPDSRTIVFVTSEPSATTQVPVIYSIQEDGKRLARITSGGAAQGEGEGGPGGGGFGGGIGDLTISRDGRTLFFRERDGIYSIALGAGAASAVAGRGPATGGGEGARRRINFNVRVKINRPTEWAEMFGDAWRTMKYRFYDPAMHGMDWDAAKAKYEPLVEFVGDRQELLNIINEMIGELNASHTGAAPPPRGLGGAGSTGHLGIELEPDTTAGRYRVAYIYENGPADKDWVKVSVGDYLVAIGGKEVKAGDEYWQLLNDRLNRKVEVTFNNKPSTEGAWKTRIEAINSAAYSNLRYERWVKERRQKVDELSGGRIAYLHIQAMNPPSLRKFEKEVREFRNKEAMIIDQRWNGGGNIEQELLAILVQRQYQVWQPRGVEASGRPFAGYFGPKVVLQNWRSASNAEMFPAGFRALGLGKVIGTPTMGAVIGTGSYSLIDGSTVRTPGVGVYLADAKHTNMENYGVQPDIRVDNLPEDNLAGRDRQLDVAVEDLMKQLGSQKRNIASKEQQ
ncbi:MAG TPA: S41 family peptidase [Pyrinomonadaceae bacterium]|jgi:tricorn protease|nr:S41 family peptidase [Pyrinomonadaceae bacterium]